MALPHANPRLELDCCLLLDYIDLQWDLPSHIQLPPQDCSPPGLNHPGPEGSCQQGPTHQGSTPPGLDLPSRLHPCYLALFCKKQLTKQSRRLLVNLSPSTTAVVSATKDLWLSLWTISLVPDGSEGPGTLGGVLALPLSCLCPQTHLRTLWVTVSLSVQNEDMLALWSSQVHGISGNTSWSRRPDMDVRNQRVLMKIKLWTYSLHFSPDSSLWCYLLMPYTITAPS